MSTCKRFSLIECIGTGDGAIDPGTLSPEDLGISLRRSKHNEDTDREVEEIMWLSESRFSDLCRIEHPDDVYGADDDDCDAIVILSQVQVPENFVNTAPGDLTIDLTVPMENTQQSECLSCGTPLDPTSSDVMCPTCGFRTFSPNNFDEAQSDQD